MDKKTITIIFLALVLISIVGVYAHNNISKENYKRGFEDATLIINDQIIRNLIENGHLNIYIPVNNTHTERVILVPLK